MTTERNDWEFLGSNRIKDPTPAFIIGKVIRARETAPVLQFDKWCWVRDAWRGYCLSFRFRRRRSKRKWLKVITSNKFDFEGIIAERARAILPQFVETWRYCLDSSFKHKVRRKGTTQKALPQFLCISSEEICEVGFALVLVSGDGD